MCVLCGQGLVDLHWTEQQRIESQQQTGYTARRDRIRDRRRRVEALNILLGYYKLKLRDAGTRKYVLDNEKGKTAVIDDLGQLWPAAQRLYGGPLDPLDDRLLDYLGNV
jgi:hypothetical protein